MFIPLGDDNSRRRTNPLIVYIIIGINAFVWWLQLSGGDAFTYAFSTVPFEITHHTDLASAVNLNLGGERVAIPQYPGPSPIYLTILSSMFMHGSWMHIIGNMLYLWIFGDQIEDFLGHIKFALFYLICGVAASAAHILAAPDSVIPSLGASGAIAGVLGAYLVMYPRNSVRVLLMRQIVILPALVVLGFWIVLQFLGQANAAIEPTGVAYMAHIGGFISGVFLILLFGRRRQQ